MNESLIEYVQERLGVAQNSLADARRKAAGADVYDSRATMEGYRRDAAYWRGAAEALEGIVAEIEQRREGAALTALALAGLRQAIWALANEPTRLRALADGE